MQSIRVTRVRPRDDGLLTDGARSSVSAPILEVALSVPLYVHAAKILLTAPLCVPVKMYVPQGPVDVASRGISSIKTPISSKVASTGPLNRYSTLEPLFTRHKIVKFHAG